MAKLAFEYLQLGKLGAENLPEFSDRWLVYKQLEMSGHLPTEQREEIQDKEKKRQELQEAIGNMTGALRKISKLLDDI